MGYELVSVRSTVVHVGNLLWSLCPAGHHGGCRGAVGFLGGLGWLFGSGPGPERHPARYHQHGDHDDGREYCVPPRQEACRGPKLTDAPRHRGFLSQGAPTRGRRPQHATDRAACHDEVVMPTMTATPIAALRGSWAVWGASQPFLGQL
jgi:hypothetical protein